MSYQYALRSQKRVWECVSCKFCSDDEQNFHYHDDHQQCETCVDEKDGYCMRCDQNYTCNGCSVVDPDGAQCDGDWYCSGCDRNQWCQECAAKYTHVCPLCAMQMCEGCMEIHNCSCDNCGSDQLHITICPECGDFVCQGCVEQGLHDHSVGEDEDSDSDVSSIATIPPLIHSTMNVDVGTDTE
jgi:hypothetical protein